ncbi:MAG: DUF2851 family protein [Chloroflexota bacterium]
MTLAYGDRLAGVMGAQAHTGGAGVSPVSPPTPGVGRDLVCEPRAKYEPARKPARLLEADLWQIWEGQRFPKKALVTTAGEAIRVIFRGRPGAGAGPDFRGAMISSPHGLLSGDVELHVRTSDFRRHGHGLDPNYANIALHVVFFHDEDGDTPLPGGGPAPVLALGGPQAARWLETPARWGEPCRDAAQRMGAEGLAAALDRLGAMRFRQKTAAWRKRLASGEPLEEALWSGVLEALAYGGERVAFRRLAAELPWTALRAALEIEPRDGADFRGLKKAPPILSSRPEFAAANGAERSQMAVAVNGPEMDKWNGRDGRREGADFRGLGSAAAHAHSLLTDAFACLGVEPLRTVRPGNGVEKRLAGAAALADRFAGPGLAAALIGPLAEPESAAQEIVAALTVPRLVGRARAIEIAGNAVLPLAAALVGTLADVQIEGVFAQLPAPARYGAVRHLHGVADGAVKVGMRRQQGMLYLLHQYCTQGGCGKCPLS